ncbi:MAG: sialidase family protein [Steroidobacteraceae bacterium]
MKRQRLVILAALFLPLASIGGESVLVSDSAHKAQSPEIAVGADGSINIVWIDQDPAPQRHDTGGHEHSHMSTTNLYFARSTDGGGSFSAPTRVNANEGDVWGFSVSKPRVVVGNNGTIHVFYPANDVNPVNGKPEAVALYTRSIDKGKSFAAPQRLNTMARTDASHLVHGGLTHAHVFGTLAVGADESVYALWIDTRDMSQEGDSGKAFMAISRDDGKTWDKDFELFPADVCPCCQITAYVADDGALYVGSRQVDGKFRDSTVAISRDGGRSFAPRKRIVGSRWEIAGCPLKPTSVVAHGKHVYAAYYTGGENPQGAYFVSSTDGGDHWSQPKLLHEGAMLSDAPVLSLSDGKLFAFWHAKVTDGPRRVFASMSDDEGLSFSAPVELPLPDGAAQLPVVAARGDGGVQLAWQQDATVRTMRWPATPAAPQVADAK